MLNLYKLKIAQIFPIFSSLNSAYVVELKDEVLLQIFPSETSNHLRWL